MKKTKIAIIYALAAALFYALNIPCSKLLLNQIQPTLMAAFLYLGAGLGVGIMSLFHHDKKEESLSKRDLPYTIGMVLLDILAPILLMIGLSMANSANASLLGNFEIVATSLIALLLFKEKVSIRLWIAITLITISSIILSFDINGLSFSLGSIFVLAATICWGLENNCTRCLSNKSTYQIVMIKGIFSGIGSLIIALLIKEQIPDIKMIILATLLGYIAYGLSIFTYIRAQKYLGAAKTSAYYALAPFLGGFLSLILLNEPLTINYLIALLVMIIGTIFVIKDSFDELGG